MISRQYLMRINVPAVVRHIRRYRTILLMLMIVLTAFALRSWGRDWDGYTHQHPDERMLVMVADRIRFPDQLNPDFFNYGSLPVYILRGTAQLLDLRGNTYGIFANYDGLLRVGRVLSSLADTLTVLMVGCAGYLLTRKKSVALFASLLYSIAFFPIQNSHFFVVDVFLTLTITLAGTMLIAYVKTRKLIFLVLGGVALGASLAVKFSALLFFPGFVLTLLITPLSHSRKQQEYGKALLRASGAVMIVMFTSVLTFCIAMPYAVLPPTGILSSPAQDSPSHGSFSLAGVLDVVHFMDPSYSPQTRFLRDIREQTRMNTDAYVFPYTLQYVTTRPYIYYASQVFVWGLGPCISILAVWGGAYALLRFLRKGRYRRSKPQSSSTVIQLVGLCLMYGIYVLVIGNSAVKFMRYMLPLYPLLALSAGYGLFVLIHTAHQTWRTDTRSRIALVSACILTSGALLWSLAFLSIYAKTNTRIRASEWILEHINAGATLAVEHWDDRVPIRYGEQYRYVEMTVYDQPDSEKKWQDLYRKLEQADYLILASNRLYTPLPKIADCARYRLCYPRAAQYYSRLFDGSLGWRVVKEFTSYPRLGPWEIRDDDADESFTVYDHPRIVVFAKESAP